MNLEVCVYLYTTEVIKKKINIYHFDNFLVLPKRTVEGLLKTGYLQNRFFEL